MRPCDCASAVPWGPPWVTEINNISLTEINSSKLILPFPVAVRLWMSSLALYPGRGRLAAFNTSVKSLVSMKPFPLISAKIKTNFKFYISPVTFSAHKGFFFILSKERYTIYKDLLSWNLMFSIALVLFTPKKELQSLLNKQNLPVMNLYFRHINILTKLGLNRYNCHSKVYVLTNAIYRGSILSTEQLKKIKLTQYTCALIHRNNLWFWPVFCI